MKLEIKWIKITTDIFDDEKIRLIESMPESDTILVIWFKLLAMAGRTNDNGSIYISKKMPTTDEMLATIFRRSLNSVRMALKVFENFEMIEINDHIDIVNWEKHQNIDGMEKIRKQNAERQKKFKEKKKELIENKKVTLLITFGNATDKEEDKEEDKDKDKMIDKEIKKVGHCPDMSINIQDKEKEQTNQSIKDYINLVSEATEVNLFQIQQAINLASLRNFDINMLIIKIKESDFLSGKLDTKPTIRNFTQEKMLNLIMADSYKNKIKETNTVVKDFSESSYKADDESENFLNNILEGIK